MPNLESIIKKFKSKNLVYPILFFSLSCGNNESGNPVQQTQTPNKSPETTIKSPQNNSTINSKTVIAEWSGYDSDGSVVGYLFSLDNAIKIYQEGTSKSFNNLSEGLHSLEVASRDDKGQNDLTPAHVSFTVKNTNTQISLTTLKASIIYADPLKNREYILSDYSVSDPMPPASIDWEIINTSDSEKPLSVEAISMNCPDYPAALHFS